jgi:hypothetical protein
MGLIGVVLIIIGIPFLLGGWITVLKLAFQEGFVTGIGCLFIPLILILFALLRLRDTKNGVMAYVGGLALIVLGASLLGA